MLTHPEPATAETFAPIVTQAPTVLVHGASTWPGIDGAWTWRLTTLLDAMEREAARGGVLDCTASYYLRMVVESMAAGVEPTTGKRGEDRHLRWMLRKAGCSWSQARRIVGEMRVRVEVAL